MEWGRYAWAESFRHLPSLRTLVIDFDTVGGRRYDVEEWAEWASRVWRFPLGPRPDEFTYLSAQGNPVGKVSWRGAPCFLRPCTRCVGLHAQALGADGEECPWSAGQISLIEKGYGERVYSWTVTWTARVGKPWIPPLGRGGSAEVGEPTGQTMWDDEPI